ncbi:alpha/beta hydrolase family protein [Rhodococcus sp. IEGM 1408]|uniref:alpha/beta hydrolase n=1 Tax=Rhodococcus sp. IEGM 1408 TaxID=3082220 RepID=UPI002955BADF|nr:alpha/beta hydrolase family protein [Rhodococcus sp. IEGM 1408]MDV7999932.1 alpha/beta hydrolase family protein [Rhodococcus sp. IEGM 1408]
MNTRLRCCAVVGALVVGMALGPARLASAQIGGGIDTSSLGLEEVELIGSAAGSLPLGSTLGSLGSAGSTNIPLGGTGSYVELPNPPRPRDESIETVELRGITRHGEYEHWLVTSAAMQREIVLEVLPSRVEDEGPAPVLYLLDGVDSIEGNSGWKRAGNLPVRFGGENVHLVTPTGGPSTYWSDWQSEDEVFGYNKWETFLTKELPDLVEAELDTRETKHNGKNGIAGASMGAQAAMHLGATYPELYDGVIGLSGYYSTTDELGYQSIRGAVDGRGGDSAKMWGPRGSDRWKYHDTISHVGGLEGTAVYFATGGMAISEGDRQNYGDDYFDMLQGLVLEKGVIEGAKNFSRELDRHGIAHRVDYGDEGLHGWQTFVDYITPGWNHIKPALQN